MDADGALHHSVAGEPTHTCPRAAGKTSQLLLVTDKDAFNSSFEFHKLPIIPIFHKESSFFNLFIQTFVLVLKFKFGFYSLLLLIMLLF